MLSENEPRSHPALPNGTIVLPLIASSDKSACELRASRTRYIVIDIRYITPERRIVYQIFRTMDHPIRSIHIDHRPEDADVT